MKKIIGLLFLFNGLVFSSSVSAQDQFSLTRVQLVNLGVKLGNPQQVRQIPLLNAPATVLVPPDQEYIVSASLAGLVSHLYAALGDTVIKGELLATIQSPGLLSLQRQYLKAGNQRNLAWSGYQRDKKLHDEGIISGRRWQETSARYYGFAAEFNEAKQLLTIAGVSDAELKKLVKTRKLTSQLKLHAPIDGVVLDRLVVAGERIDILAPIYRIADLKTLWLEINIPQERIADIEKGDRVLVSGSSATARISLLGQYVNPQNQTILARAIIENYNGSIRVGQSVNTQIIQNSPQAMFKVPNTAVAQREGRYYIFVRTESGFAVKPVRVLGKEDRHFIVSGDFDQDQRIAVKGSVALKAKWMGLGEGDSE